MANQANAVSYAALSLADAAKADAKAPEGFPTFLKRFYASNVKGKEFKVDLWAMPTASLDAIMAYGVQRIVNDASGGGETDAQKQEKAQKKLDSLYAGEVRQIVSRATDAVAAQARDEAIADATRYVTAALKSGADEKTKAWGERAAKEAGVAFPFQGEDSAAKAANKAKAIKSLAKLLLESEKFGPAIKARAEKIVAERDSEALPDLDL